MKKASLSSLAALVFLLITSTVCFVTKPLFTTFDITILIALGIITASALVAFLVRRSVLINVICFLISGVAFGIAMRAWYIFLGVECDLLSMAIMSVGVAVFFFIFGLIMRIRAIREHKVILIILIALYVLLDMIPVYFAIALAGNVQLSTIGYFLIATWGFIIPLILESDDVSSFVRNLALATYSVMVVIVVIIIVAVALISGEDISDDGDVDCLCESDSEGCCDTLGERIKESFEERRFRRHRRRSEREAEREWFGR